MGEHCFVLLVNQHNVLLGCVDFKLDAFGQVVTVYCFADHVGDLTVYVALVLIDLFDSFVQLVIFAFFKVDLLLQAIFFEFDVEIMLVESVRELVLLLGSKSQLFEEICLLSVDDFDFLSDLVNLSSESNDVRTQGI